MVEKNKEKLINKITITKLERTWNPLLTLNITTIIKRTETKNKGVLIKYCDETKLEILNKLVVAITTPIRHKTKLQTFPTFFPKISLLISNKDKSPL